MLIYSIHLWNHLHFLQILFPALSAALRRVQVLGTSYLDSCNNIISTTPFQVSRPPLLSSVDSDLFKDQRDHLIMYFNSSTVSLGYSSLVSYHSNLTMRSLRTETLCYDTCITQVSEQCEQGTMFNKQRIQHKVPRPKPAGAVHGASARMLTPSPWSPCRLLFDTHVYRLTRHSKNRIFSMTPPSLKSHKVFLQKKSCVLFRTTKDTINRRKRQPRKWEKIFENYISDGGWLIPGIYKNLLQFNNNDKNNN